MKEVIEKIVSSLEEKDETRFKQLLEIYNFNINSSIDDKGNKLVHLFAGDFSALEILIRNKAYFFHASNDNNQSPLDLLSLSKETIEKVKKTIAEPNFLNKIFANHSLEDLLIILIYNSKYADRFSSYNIIKLNEVIDLAIKTNFDQVILLLAESIVEPEYFVAIGYHILRPLFTHNKTELFVQILPLLIEIYKPIYISETIVINMIDYCSEENLQSFLKEVTKSKELPTFFLEGDYIKPFFDFIPKLDLSKSSLEESSELLFNKMLQSKLVSKSSLNKGNCYLLHELAISSYEEAKANNLKIVYKFLSSEIGISINYQNKYGRTPLHLATLQKKVLPIKILLEMGADITLRDTNGLTAEDLLESTNYSLIKKIKKEEEEISSNYNNPAAVRIIKFSLNKNKYLEDYQLHLIRVNNFNQKLISPTDNPLFSMFRMEYDEGTAKTKNIFSLHKKESIWKKINQILLPFRLVSKKGWAILNKPNFPEIRLDRFLQNYILEFLVDTSNGHYDKIISKPNCTSYFNKAWQKSVKDLPLY